MIGPTEPRTTRLLALLSVCASACAAQPSSAPASAPSHAEPPAESVPYLADFARETALLSASPLELLASGAGIAGDSLSAFVSIPKGRCAVVAARGAPQVDDLDLYLFADDGDEIAASEEVEHPATLLHCAEAADERVLVVARIAGGQGPYALGLVDAPADREPSLRAKVLAGADGSDGPPEDWPGLDAALALHRDLLGATWRDVRRVVVPTDHRLPTQLDFSVDPKRCVDALLLPSSAVDDLDVEALGPSGRVFARAEEEGAERALLVCAGAEPAHVTLRLRPHAGRGGVLVALSETRLESDRRNLHPEFPRHDLAPEPGPLLKPGPSAKRLDLGTASLISMPLSSSGCQRVELEPRFPLLGFRLAAFDAEGRLIGEAEGTGKTVLHLCAQRASDGTARMDLRATLRAGPIDIRSLAEAAPVSATLERFPLAASRLLGLAAELGFVTEIEDIGQVSAHELGPDQLVRIPLSVPAARCLTVLSAADRSSGGIELGLVDVSTSRFADFARGSSAIFARVCADQGQTVDIVVELRAPYGETPVLVATRQESLKPSAALLR